MQRMLKGGSCPLRKVQALGFGFGILSVLARCQASRSLLWGGREEMTDSEKLEMIRKLLMNIPVIGFTDEKVGIGAAHALCVAIEIIIESKDQKHG